jgi:hypothetical protein
MAGSNALRNRSAVLPLALGLQPLAKTEYPTIRS